MVVFDNDVLYAVGQDMMLLNPKNFKLTRDMKGSTIRFPVFHFLTS